MPAVLGRWCTRGPTKYTCYVYNPCTQPPRTRVRVRTVRHDLVGYSSVTSSSPLANKRRPAGCRRRADTVTALCARSRTRIRGVFLVRNRVAAGVVFGPCHLPTQVDGGKVVRCIYRGNKNCCFSRTERVRRTFFQCRMSRFKRRDVFYLLSVCLLHFIVLLIMTWTNELTASIFLIRFVSDYFFRYYR